MKLIDKLFRKLGYAKIPKPYPVIEKKEYEIVPVRVRYELPSPYKQMQSGEPFAREMAMQGRAIENELLSKLKPFMETISLSEFSSQYENEQCEIRIMVAVPKKFFSSSSNQ